MSIKKIDVRFYKSSNDYKQCPEGGLPEFAFIGRSNVGKSSLINLLASVKNLAKTSSRPGKTQLINHFLVSPPEPKTTYVPGKKEVVKEISKPGKGSWYIVDLPGYGYAKTSKTSRSHFEELIKGYIVTRPNLHCLFVLIDSRLEPQKNDLEFIEFLGQFGVPFVLIFTKADKITNNQLDSNVSKFKKELLANWEELPPIFITSAETKLGREEILSFIDKHLKNK